MQHRIAEHGSHGIAGRAPRRSEHPYLYRGLVRCGLCQRRMSGGVHHGRIYYRCVASRNFTRQHHLDHPPTVYVRQDTLTAAIDDVLGAAPTEAGRDADRYARAGLRLTYHPDRTAVTVTVAPTGPDAAGRQAQARPWLAGPPAGRRGG